MVRVRLAASGDAERMTAIWLDNGEYYAGLAPEHFQRPEEAGLVEWLTEMLEQEPPEDELSLVAEVDAAVVGNLQAYIAQPLETAHWQYVKELGVPRLVIDVLAVERAYWRKGVGSALVSAAEEWGREHGARLAAVNTYVNSPVSVSFYEQRMGYLRKSIELRKALD